jgi:Tol biopolymer transport system component
MQNVRLGDDGELEIDEVWEGGKAKRPGSTWQRLARSPVIPLLLLAQMACIALACLGTVLIVVVPADLTQLRCRLFGACPRPTLMPTQIATDVAGRSAPTSRPPEPTRQPAVAMDAPCNTSILASAEQKAAFISDRQSPFGAVYVAEIASPAACRLFTHNEGVYSVAWSPDGKRIAFGSSRGIWLANADGTSQQRLAGIEGSDETVGWSPDGSRLLFVSEQGDGGASIRVIGVDGTGQRQLTDDRARNLSPAWSPDGRQVAFASDRDGTSAVYVIAADGTNVRRLTSGPDYHPDWSPDGARIVFGSDRDGDREIYVMDSDGSNVRRLTASPARDDYPRWSADNRSITFVSYRDGNNEIYVMDADGGNLRRLTNHRANDTRPVWIP